MTPEPNFRAKAYRDVRKTTPHANAEGGPWSEPVMGVDWAEQWLLEHGTPEQSFVDLYLNGDKMIHTSIYYLRARKGGQEPVFGIANSSHARWPVDYVGADDDKIDPNSDIFGRNITDWQPGDSDEDEVDDDADVLDLGKDREDQKDKDDEDEDDGEEEEEEDDDEDDNEIFDEPDDDNDDDGKEEKEMPRLTIFAKMRGPRGWRKRAETDTEREVNRFGLKIGVLDPDGISTARQERNAVVEIDFREYDSNRTHGELRLVVPDGVELERKGRYLVARIPYGNEKQ